MEDINRKHGRIGQNREQKLASSERMIQNKKKHALTGVNLHEMQSVFIVYFGRKAA